MEGNQVRIGTYVNFDTAAYGKGSGQVLNVIEKDGIKKVVCERFLNKRNLKDTELEPTIIVIDLKEVTVNNNLGINQRMRFR